MKKSHISVADKLGKWFLKIQGKYQEANKEFFDNLDDMTLEQAIKRYKGYQKMLWIIPLAVWFVEFILFFVPFQSLNFQFLTLIVVLALMINLVGVNTINWFLMNLYTREPNTYKEDRLSKIQDLLKVRNYQRALTFGGVINTVVTMTLIPYYEFLRNNPDLQGWTIKMTDQVNGNDFLIKLLMVSLPLFITINLYQLERKTADQYRDELVNGIENKEYTNPKLHHMLSNESKEEQKAASHVPNMIIGKSIQTGEPVMQSVTTRRQNAIYFGAVGSGKSKTIFISQINQDLDKAIAYIRDFRKISKQPGFMTQTGNIATQYLSGLALIDPTNDLNKDVYNLCKAKGIPDDMIMWFDPSNPHTAGINLMRGPVEKVAEDLTNVIAGVEEGSQDFFHEAGRNHLKNYVYLLKITSTMEKTFPTLENLIKMYNSPYETRRRMKMLDAYLKVLKGKLDASKSTYEANKLDENNKTVYLELKDKYEIAESTAAWFKLNIIPNRKGNSVVKRSDPEVQGLDDKDPDKWEYIDAQAEYVRGLANILDDISKNMGLRRVLFRDSGDFTLDDAMHRGKILLFNTDKEHVGASLAKTLGQIYLGALEAATLRRTPNAVPMFPIYMDEFSDFLDESFAKFISQSRKFSVPCVIATQSPSQLSYSYGPEWFKTLVDDVLTVGTFGNMSPDSAEIFEKFFGTKTIPKRSANEQQVGLMQGMDDNRRMVTTRMEEVPNITADELMAMDKYTVAVRTPNPRGFRGSMLFNIIRTDYIDDKVVAKNPNNFHVSDPNDADGLDAILHVNKIENPDFDEVDKEIRDEFLSGKVSYEFTKTGAKVILPGNHPKHDTKQVINSKLTPDPDDNGESDSQQKPENNDAKNDNNLFGDSGSSADSGVNFDQSDEQSDLMGGLFGNGLLDTDTGSNDDAQNQEVDNSKDASNTASESQTSDSTSNLFNSNQNDQDTSDDDLFNNLSSGSEAARKDAEFAKELIAKAKGEKKPEPAKNETQAPKEDKESIFGSKESAELLKQVVNPAGKHGGNNRFKRDIVIEDDPLTKSNSNSSTQNTNSSQKAVENTPANDSNLKKERDKDMLNIDPRTGKLKEDKKNRDEMEKRYLARQKQHNVNDAVDHLTEEAQNKLNQISAQKLPDKQKINQINDLRKQYDNKFNSINPDGMPMELGTAFDGELDKLKQDQQKEENQGIVFGANATDNNINDLKGNQDLLNSIKEMMNQQEDPNFEVDLNKNKVIRNAYQDHDFNDKDPFYNQPGMKGDRY